MKQKHSPVELMVASYAKTSPDETRITSRTFSGNNAFATVAENRFTYGKVKPVEWDCDAALLPCSEATRLPSGRAARTHGQPSAANLYRDLNRGVVTERVTVRHKARRKSSYRGGKVAVAELTQTVKRFPVTVTDRVTGEQVEVLAKLITNEVSVLCYGKLVTFRCTNRGLQSFHDSRDDRRHPIGFAKSELCRMLGVTEGMVKFAELVTLPPKRPVAQMPATA